MGIKEKALAFSKKFKLDSHHAIERFGVFFGIFALAGVIVLGGSGASAFQAHRESLSHTALYTPKFETSKTGLGGTVDGIYTNESGNKALVMMHFDSRAAISYNAADYRAFLLGSNTKLSSETVETSGIKGSFQVFGSTGYVGVLLEADQPFKRQILNLTVRANAELSYDENSSEAPHDEVSGDETFEKYDQWRVYFNPGASDVNHIPSLDAMNFDPAQAYYDIVLKDTESEVRSKLDKKLIEMRTNLAQITSYTADLETTKVDGLFLRPPAVPASVDGDKVVGESASEAKNGKSTLELKTDYVVPGGFDLNWRSGNVYDGYLDVLVPSGQSYIEFLSEKTKEDQSSASEDISDMQWILSDGSDLKSDYQASDVTMRPLINVMNNLSQAYQDYARSKSQYQSDLMLELLQLDVQLRDVQSNGSAQSGSDFLTILY